MINQNKKISILDKKIGRLIDILEKGNFIELMYLIGNKKEIIKRNLLAGIFRGIGIGIGVSLISAILIIFLQKIVTLNIPIIGEYIGDIVEIVERTR